MTDKAKPPQPMAFKNLAELKRYIKIGTEFKATSHKYHPDIVGLTRVVTKVQTNGFYSKIKDEPNHRFSDCNNGKGFFTEFGKAGGYIFDGTRSRCWTSAVKTESSTNWNFTEKTRR